MTEPAKTNRDVHLERGQEVRERILPWVGRVMVPRLGFDAANFDLEFPKAGEHSHVYILASGRDRAVVRLFDHRASRVRTMRVERHCRKRGIRVPRVLGVFSARRVRRETGFSFLVEEWVAGEHPHLMQDRERALRATGRGLARLTDMTRRRWGNLAVGRRRGYWEDHMRNVTKLVSRLRRTDWARAGEVGCRLLDWMRGWRAVLSSMREFSLGHRAVIGSNLIVTEDDDLCLIDFQRVRYEADHSTLVRALACICRNRDEEERALGHFFAASKRHTREEFDRHRPPFDALWLLKLLQSRIRDAESGRVGGVESTRVARLESLLEIDPAG